MLMAPEDRTPLPHCPVCAKPMAHVRTIWRGLAPDTRVFRCIPCDVTVRENPSERTARMLLAAILMRPRV